MKHFPKMAQVSCSGAIFSLLAAALLTGNLVAAATTFSIPNRCRTEGQVTLVVPNGNQNVEHHLPFSETLDAKLSRSAVSIGYLGRNPNRYYAKQSMPTVFLNSDGLCELDKESNLFVPELFWFVEFLLPNYNLLQIDKHLRSFIGPTGLFDLVSVLGSQDVFKSERAIVHRNVLCKVYSRITQLHNKKLTVKVDIFVPTEDVLFRNVKSSYFSVRISSYEGEQTDKMRASIMLDYYNIDSFDNQPERFNMILEDFNLPLARGCSEFVQSFKPNIDKRSFAMNYYQVSRAQYQNLAYDHDHGFLRKEWPNKAYNVWDLKEEILYHVVTNLQNNALHNVLNQAVLADKLASCAVLKVKDDKLGPAYRPFSLSDNSLDIIQMFGAAKLSYIGQSIVRDMPCLVYESILDEPPFVFSLTEEPFIMRKVLNKYDYIIQFHILKPTSDANFDELAQRQMELALKNFWPAKIRLYRRIKAVKRIDLLDELEIYDYSSTLEGGARRSSELFSVGECFTNDEQQAKVELAYTFDQIHYNQPEESKSREALATLMAYNKFPLESFLVEDMVEQFHISRAHLVDFRMKLEPHHVNLELHFSDRDESKSLMRLGEGNLPRDDSYESNRVVIASESEENCLLFSSLINDISMVVYCPFTSNRESSCTAVYNERDPAFRAANGDKTNTTTIDEAACQVYRLRPSSVPLKAVSNLSLFRSSIADHRFKTFEATIPDGLDTALIFTAGDINHKAKRIELTGYIRDFEVSHSVELEIIDNYTFVVENQAPEVKSFKTFAYENQGDCAKMCNLDPSCRSYSYCSSKESKEESNNCAWSSLDIRVDKVKNQLIFLTPNEENNQTVNVNGSGNKNYKLKFEDDCDTFERDYLSMYRETSEIVRINKVLVNQFQSAISTFECAKESIELERQHAGHHVATFAFCPSANLCLLDEQLFTTTNFSTNELLDQADTDEKIQVYDQTEVVCKVYRKKYQSYFTLSGSVFKQHEQQVEFEFKNVEECARACWNKFGETCASFDFCSPGSCLINEISLQSRGSVELENRQSCLHYDRDLTWDQVSLEHSLGRHKIYNSNQPGSGSGSAVGTFFTYAFSLVAFIGGLFMGIRVSDKMDAVKIIRQSISGESGGRRQSMFASGMRGISAARQMFGFQGFQSSNEETNYLAADDIYQEEDDMRILHAPNAIRLDVIGENKANNLE